MQEMSIEFNFTHLILSSENVGIKLTWVHKKYTITMHLFNINMSWMCCLDRTFLCWYLAAKNQDQKKLLRKKLGSLQGCITVYINVAFMS